MYHNIKIEMEKQNKTIRGFAAELGIHENALRRYINGSVRLTVSMLKRIAEKLGKSILYLSEWEK
jgi:transcriptional regulator with XRE-family HTH domain